MRVMLVLAILVAGMLLACGGDDDDAEEARQDPYEIYLANAPERPADWEGEWPLSREDAQARALLGCGQQWAPGTIDAALQAAYRDLC